MGRLDDKVAIITGGASGMGEASARLFVQEGARVVIGDVQDDKAHALAASLGAACVTVRTDVTSGEDVRALVRTAVDRFGKLDVMYNNAGGGRRLTPEELGRRVRAHEERTQAVLSSIALPASRPRARGAHGRAPVVVAAPA